MCMYNIFISDGEQRDAFRSLYSTWSTDFFEKNRSLFGIFHCDALDSALEHQEVFRLHVDAENFELLQIMLGRAGDAIDEVLGRRASHHSSELQFCPVVVLIHSFHMCTRRHWLTCEEKALKRSVFSPFLALFVSAHIVIECSVWRFRDIVRVQRELVKIRSWACIAFLCEFVKYWMTQIHVQSLAVLGRHLRELLLYECCSKSRKSSRELFRSVIHCVAPTHTSWARRVMSDFGGSDSPVFRGGFSRKFEVSKPSPLGTML